MNNPIWTTSFFDSTTISKCNAEEAKTAPVFRHANYFLSNNKPKDALDLFTKILMELSPGHPVAFLNRSLCYLLLDFPELAVTDAYRAFISTCYSWNEYIEPLTIAQILTQTSASPFKIDVETKSHAKIILEASLAALHLRQRRPETTEMKKRLDTRTYIWNSITREEMKEGARYIQDKEPLRSIVEDLRMKAYYRTALALFKCGGGAIKSALEIIHNAKDEDFMTPQDSLELSRLEDLICQQMEELYMSEKGLGKAATARDSKPNGQGKHQKTTNSVTPTPAITASNGRLDVQYILEHRGVAAMIASQQTMIPREVYPWDTFSLTEETSERYMEALSVEIRKDTENASPFINKEPGRRASTTVLQGNQDITAGAHILKDNTPFFVTTGQNNIGDGDLICDVCGTHMLIVDETISSISDKKDSASLKSNSSATSSTKKRNKSTTLMGTAPPTPIRPSAQLRPSNLSIPNSSEYFEEAEDGETSEGSPGIAGPVEIAGSPVYIPDSPILHVVSSLSSSDLIQNTMFPRSSLEYTLCQICRSVYFCCSGCHVLSNELQHRKLCDLEIDPRQLINHNLRSPEFPGIPHVQNRKLQSLMMLRLITFFSNETSCPLSPGWVRWKLDGKLDSPRQIQEGRSHWSIGKMPKETYKLFPHLIFDYTRPGTCSSDGSATSLIHWSFQSNVVFPLFALRELGGLPMALDVNRFDGWVLNTLMAKIDGSMIVTEHTRRYKLYRNRRQTHSGIHGDRHVLDPRLKNSIWVGSLHFTSSLIPIANEAAGEKPNVTVIENGRSLIVIAGTDETFVSRSESLTSSSGSEAANSPSVGESFSSGDVFMATPKQTGSSKAALPPAPIVIREGDRLFRSAQIDRVHPAREPSSQSFLDKVEAELVLDETDSDDVLYSTEAEDWLDMALGGGPMDLD